MNVPQHVTKFPEKSAPTISQNPKKLQESAKKNYLIL